MGVIWVTHVIIFTVPAISTSSQDLVNEMEDLVAWLRVVVGCAGTGRGAPLTAVVPVDTVDVGI